MEHPAQHEDFAALIGIDWSDAKHDICLVDTATGCQELSVIKHTPESLDEWARSLRSRFGGAPVAVCLEQSRGPLIYALLKYDFFILYPINPKTLARVPRGVYTLPRQERPDRCPVPRRVADASPGASHSVDTR